MNVDVSIIIVGYNSEITIKDCLDSLIGTIKKHSYEVIISDNSPTDKTKELIGKVYKDNKNITFFKNESNLGFSKANNRGVKKSKGKFVLFLNPDTIVYKNTIDGMIDFMIDTKNCGVSTCFVELPNKKLDQSSHRGFPTPLRSLSYFSGLSKLFPKNKTIGGYSLSYLDLNKTHEIDSAAGSFMLVRREIGEKIGWWDEDYFFYGEDIDFCYRVKELGYKVYFVPEFKALHLKGVSSGIKKESKNLTQASSKTKSWANYHRFRAMEIFYDKHYKKKYPKLITIFVKSGIKLKKFLT